MTYLKSALYLIAFAALAPVIAGCSPSSQFSRFAAPLVAALPNPQAEQQENTETAEAEIEPEPEPVSLLAYAEPVAPRDTSRDEIDRLITKYAAFYGVPASLVHDVVRRESTYNPKARNGIHIGLMQLNPRTARTMGYTGPDEGLFNPDTNLKFGVKYLAGAYLVADRDASRADRLYQSGYYYHAKRKGLLEETGLRP